MKFPGKRIETFKKKKKKGSPPTFLHLHFQKEIRLKKLHLPPEMAHIKKTDPLLEN
jgi:hypothetical protein